MPASKLHVVGDIRLTGSLIDVSDERLKTDIQKLTVAGSILDRIDQISGYSFTMKDDEKTGTEYGVLAQEIERVFPELVVTADDELGTKAVKYSGLIAPLIEATKALKAENEKLQADIAKRDDRLTRLENRMANFELAMARDVKGLKAHTGYGVSKGSFLSLIALMGVFALMGSFAATIVMRRHG